VAFTDGLGQRHHTDGPGSEPLEVLTLRKDLTTGPAFEFALRERVSRLAGFHHPCYGQVRGVSRLGTDAASLALVSDRVTGERLSDVLAVAGRNLIPLEIGAGLGLIRQLLDAVASLHETIPDVCHGAIALERIVITPAAGVVLVEHVLGGALGSLQYSRDRYWKELRIALPPTAGAPHFDRRADVTQIGAIALALITGRPLGDHDYPDRVGEIVSRVGAVSGSGGFAPLPDIFRTWLSRALQLDPRQSFGSAGEAREELDRVLAETGYAAAPANLQAFLGQCGAQASTGAAVAAAPIAFPSAARVPASSPSIKRPTSSPSNAAPRSSLRHVAPVTAPPVQAARAVPRVIAPPRRRFVVAAALAVTIASMGTLTARTFLIPPELPPAETGTLLVNSSPAGASVTIDGRPRGRTPLVVAMLPGEHLVEVEGETGSRKVPVFVFADGHVGQFIQLPKPSADAEETQAAAEPRTASKSSEGVITPSPLAPPGAPIAGQVSGWISVKAPADVELYENHRFLGTSRTSRIAMAAGRHELEIVSKALGYTVTRVVTVSSGKVAPVALDWPNGSLSVNALPWAEVFINGERIGETPIGNVALPIGTHEVVFRHPELGEKSQRVTVTAAAPARLSVDLSTR
jgi:hypothetical protein